ncbi:hypothetical protein E3Q08_02789 [Wallemia mellicola]|nr:hypothetical protein E3Q08_02789 [Wallemia mellicola]
MPLNYDKWANLELSDDSDIEVHPNVDKKSFINNIRWKQQDIHQKREARKAQLVKLNHELEINSTLLPRVTKIRKGVDQSGPEVFSGEVARLGSQPSNEKPNTGADNQPTYDEMMQNLFIQIWEKAREHLDNKDLLSKTLVEELQKTEDKVTARNEDIKKEISVIEEEESQKITSEGIRTGFDSSHVNKITDTKPQQPQKETEKSIEVLNPGASKPKKDDDDLPDLTTSMKRLAEVPLRQYRGMVDIISHDKALLADETTDALFVEAFNAGMENKADYALKCVNAGLFVQYCNKLGRDGVSLFIQRLTQSKEAETVFLKDVNDTHARIMERSKVLASQQSSNEGEKEQIQLMTEGDTEITFDVPEGPAPEKIVLEGDAKLQQLDPEVVKEWLNQRWEIFESFDNDFQMALKSGKLDIVNAYLGNQPVSKAEKIVQDLDRAGILNFSSTEIRDETK